MSKDADSLFHEVTSLKWRLARCAAEEAVRVSAAVEADRHRLSDGLRELLTCRELLATDRAKLEKDRATFCRERDHLRDRLQNAADRINELEAKCGNMAESLSKLRAECEWRRTNEEEILESSQALKDEHERLLRDLAERGKECDGLRQSCETASLRCHELECERTRNVAELAALRLECDRAKQEVLNSNARCQDLVAESQRVSEELDAAKDALAVIENATFWKASWPLRRALDLSKYHVRRYISRLKPSSVYWNKSAFLIRILLLLRINEIMKRVCPYSYYKCKKRIISGQIANKQGDVPDSAEVSPYWQQFIWQRRVSAARPCPLVSVVVPNYNHAPYLRERLDSIYSQTYRNFEVILMDDDSSDGSRRILRHYARKYHDRTRLVFNEKNSGSPFAQWRKGIRAARGELVWIAESDDWCDANFLEILVPEFQDEAIKLAFCRTSFVRDGQEVWRIEDYLHDIGRGLFNASFRMSAHQIVRHFFSKKNIVPNVSSCVFRKPCEMPLFDDAEWNVMRVCGDWVFYLHLIRGGAVSYSISATNYYRQHDANTSVNLQKCDRYYQEHAIVAEYLARSYALSEDELGWMVEDLRRFWRSTRTDYSEAAYDALISRERIFSLRKERLPNVVICGFAFETGGGEQVPIDQANALYRAGVAVTFVDCGGVKRNEMIRQRLLASIPVVSLDWDYSSVYHMLVQLGAEIVHTHHASVDFAIAVNKPESVRQVVTLHGMYETVPSEYLRINVPILNEKVSSWLYIAEKNLAVMRKYGITGNNFVRIFNAVPGNVSVRSRGDVLTECGFPDTARIVVLASRAIDGKGWHAAYRAVECVRRCYGRELDLRIVFVGNGPLYDEMKSLECEWSHFVGYSSDVASYMAAADFVTLPSTYAGESFPLCLLEAFRAGKPIVASAIGEIPAMLETQDGMAGSVIGFDGSGHVDQKALAAAYARMATDKDAYDSASHAAQAAARKFTIDGLVQKLLEVYRM